MNGVTFGAQGGNIAAERAQAHAQRLSEVLVAGDSALSGSFLEQAQNAMPATRDPLRHSLVLRRFHGPGDRNGILCPQSASCGRPELRQSDRETVWLKRLPGGDKIPVKRYIRDEGVLPGGVGQCSATFLQLGVGAFQ
ncbi:MAG: hypothetical protein BWY63_02307 [Chloroflexi bacterium ADurb.Bin360]|nr:MAG: hypothetical protein BWY63_02307 [Chloroflexi bacterium ADurb.Bin360]